MNIEFEKQSPADTMEFKRFVYNNRAEISDNETAKILFLETDCYCNDSVKFMEMILVFANPEFNNRFVNYWLIGKPRIIEYVDFNVSTMQIKFKNKYADTYDFMKSLLISDGLMNKNNNQAIICSMSELKDYLQDRQLILNGTALKNGKLIVEGII